MTTVQRMAPRCTMYHCPRHEMNELAGTVFVWPFTSNRSLVPYTRQ